jgi:hypothetical protein
MPSTPPYPPQLKRHAVVWVRSSENSIPQA